jgi:hypothetical protein
MAQTSFIMDELKAPGLGLEVIAGSFAPDTADPPETVRGGGFSVVRTSEGLFTVTLTNRYAGLIAGIATLQHSAANSDLKVELGAVVCSHAAACTVQIRVVDISSAAVADIAANANNRINFALILKTTTALDSTGIT